MAIYTFEHRKTKKVKDYEMKMAEYDDFVAAHPELQRIHTTFPGMGDPVSLGRLKPPKDFQQGVIQRIRDKVPGARSEMNRTRWGNLTEV